MDFFSFNDVRFAYPALDDEEGAPKPVFDHFTATLPAGFMSLVGPNGSGKSTLLLLAGLRLVPSQGSVTLLGHRGDEVTEQERDALASFIYQNMEFETDDNVGALLEQVYAGGYHNNPSPFAGEFPVVKPGDDFYDEVLKVFELKNVMGRKLNGISKGEIQRVLLAFSLLYGSQSVFMDEPLFAMEDHQKHAAMEYLCHYGKTFHKPVCIAMHELDLSRKYAENVLLFKPNRDMSFGSPDEVLTNEELEAAYGVPAAMLRETEQLNRRSLKEAADAIADVMNQNK